MVEVQGVETLKRFFNGLDDKIDDETRKIATEEAIKLRNRIIKSMKNTPKVNGRSVEGKPPAIDLGGLIGNIIVQKRADTVEVGPANVQYAKFLEYGTKNMKARPFMKPQFDKLVPTMEKSFSKLGIRIL